MGSRKDSRSIEYKKRLITTWNEIAPRYHRRWAKDGTGPFGSSSEIVRLAEIKPNHTVLDLACGTGAVTKNVLEQLGSEGHVTGVDSSFTAIRIAKRQNRSKKADFVLADAENFKFNRKFDAALCQYALFFFPDSQRALKNLKLHMKKNAMLALSVHGRGSTVPYFSSIIDVVTKFVPDYLPPNAPSLDRFGVGTELGKEVAKAGFSNIKIRHYCYEYSPGTFEDYWDAYLRYLATPLRQKLRTLERKKKSLLKDMVRQKTKRFTKNGDRIVFPWKVLILTAKA